MLKLSLKKKKSRKTISFSIITKVSWAKFVK